MGKPPCRDGSTPPLRPLPSLSSLPSLCSLPAPTHTLRQRYRRGQLLAVGANAMGLAQSVGLLVSTDQGRREAPTVHRGLIERHTCRTLASRWSAAAALVAPIRKFATPGSPVRASQSASKR